MLKGIKIVLLEFEKQSKLAQKWPKLAQKQPFFGFFRFPQKLSIRFERNFLQSGIRFLYVQWLGCEKQPKLVQKWPKNSRFSTFFDFRKNCSDDSNEILYSPSTLYYGPLCVISSNSYCWDVRNMAKINPKMAKKPFFDFCKNCPYYSNENFYSHFLHHSMVYVCNFNKFVGLGLERVRRKKT